LMWSAIMQQIYYIIFVNANLFLSLP